MWLVPNMTCLGSEAGAGYLLKVPGHRTLLALILQLHCCVQFHLLGFSFYSLYSSWLQVNTELQFVILIGELTQYLVACKLPQHDASCHFKWDFFSVREDLHGISFLLLPWETYYAFFFFFSCTLPCQPVQGRNTFCRKMDCRRMWDIGCFEA